MKRLCLIIAICLLAVNAQAADWYVTQAGAGDNSGHTVGNAWTADQFGTWANWNNAADHIVAGDTIYIVGTLTQYTQFHNGGSAGLPITIDGAAAGQAAGVIDVGGGAGGFYTSYDYTTFQNLEITDCTIGINNNGGDYIIVQDCEIHTNGTANAGILYTNAQYGQVLDNSIHDIGVGAGNNSAIRFDGTDDSTISGNTIATIEGRGIMFQNAADGNTVYNNGITDCTYSLIEGDGCDDMIIDDNTIAESIRGVYLADCLDWTITDNNITGVDQYAGINCVDSSNNVNISRNTVWECEGTGATTGGGIRVIVATGVLIDRNIAYSNSDGVNHSYGIQVDLLDSTSIVSNNICYLNDDQGISSLGCTGTQFYNNTCVYNLRDGIYIGEEAGATANSACVFKNNLCAENGGEGSGSSNWNQLFMHQESNAVNTFDHNIYYRAASTDVVNLFWEGTPMHTLEEWQATYDYDEHSKYADPQFVDAAAYNYKVNVGSPSVDGGTTVSGVTTDYDGLTRQNTYFDIGAFDKKDNLVFYNPFFE